MREFVLEKVCPYCSGDIQPDNHFCHNCSMDLSVFKTTPKNELVKVCPSCSREYSFETKVCRFCSRYLDRKVKPPPNPSENKFNVEDILNTFFIPGSGGLLTNKKQKAIIFMLLYFLWITAALYLVSQISIIFCVVVVPLEFFIRTIKLFK